MGIYCGSILGWLEQVECLCNIRGCPSIPYLVILGWWPDKGNHQYVVMGISWSRDPQVFQHTLDKCLASWLLAGVWGIYPCEHNMAWHVDVYWQYDAWRDNPLSFLDQVGRRTWSIFEFPHLIAKVSHFHSSRSLAFNGVVDNANSGCVVNVYWRGRLWATKFSKDKSRDLGLLCI